MTSSLGQLAAPFARRRVLITGGLGFLGSNLARSLAAAGSHVTVVDALVPSHGGLRSNLDDVATEIEIHFGDVRDTALMSRLVADRDIVFSLAGQTSHLDSMRDPFSDLEHNCRGPLAVLEACRNAAADVKVVFSSTRQLYGRPLYLPVDERHPVQPVDINGIHKATGEAYHSLFGEVYGLRAAILRLTNTYGPRMRVRDARQTFLGWWIRRLLTGEPIEVYGDGMQRRDFTYLDDALRALLLVGDRPDADGATFNLGHERSTSLRELAELLIAIHGQGEYRLVPFPSDRKAIDIGDYQADYKKIKDTMGWRPFVELEDGLQRTLAFFAEHGHRYWEDTE